MIRLSALDLPALPATAGAPSLGGGAPLAAYVRPAARRGAADPGLGRHRLARPRARHRPGRRQAGAPPTTPRASDFELIGLKDGDRWCGAAEVADDRTDLVFVTSDAQLLHFPASQVRPQGRPAGGMAGIKLTSGQRAVWFGVVDPASRPGRGDVQRVVRRPPRHRGRCAQGDAVCGVPRQGSRHRRRALSPVPQGRGHPRARLGRAGPPPGRPRPTASRSSCRPPPASGTARERRPARSSPGSRVR